MFRVPDSDDESSAASAFESPPASNSNTGASRLWWSIASLSIDQPSDPSMSAQPPAAPGSSGPYGLGVSLPASVRDSPSPASFNFGEYRRSSLNNAPPPLPSASNVTEPKSPSTVAAEPASPRDSESVSTTGVSHLEESFSAPPKSSQPTSGGSGPASAGGLENDNAEQEPRDTGSGPTKGARALFGMISDRNVKFSRSIGPQLRDQPPLSDDNPSVDGGTHEQPSASQPEQNMPSADYLPLSGQQLARDTLDEVRSMGKDTHEIKELMVAALSAQEKKTEGTLPTASARGATTKVKSRISFGNSIKYPASGPTAQNAGKNPFSFRSLNSESRGEPKSFSFGPATTADAAQPSSSKAPPDAPFAYGSNSPVMSASRWAQDLAMKDQHFAKVEGELRNLIGMQKPKAVEDLKAKDDEIAELGEALGKAAKDLGAKDGEIAKLTKSLADAKKEVGRLGTELEQAKKIPGADASEEEVKTFIRSNPVVLSFLRSSLENQKKQLREAAESKASPAGIDQSGSQVPSASGGGLFGAAHASSASGGGLFGAAHASSASGGGLFGAAHAASAPGGGLFGASSRPSGQQNASLFTDQGSNAPAKPSLFGAARSTQSPSLFGGLGQPSTNDMQSSAGLFGGLDLSQRPQGESAGGPTGGLFGGGRAPGRISGAPRSPSPGSVFGASHARSLSSNFYASQAPSSGGVFGATQPSWNGLTPQPQTGTSIGTPRPPNFGGTVFSPGATSTGFGASQPSPTGSLFGTFSPPSAQNPPRGPTPFRAPRTSPPLQPALFNQPSFGPASAPNLVHFAREHFPPGHRSAVSHNEDENEDDNSEASYRTAFPLSNSAARIGGVFGMPGAFGEPVSAFGVGYGDAGPAGSAWHPITMGCPCAMCVEIFGSP